MSGGGSQAVCGENDGGNVGHLLLFGEGFEFVPFDKAAGEGLVQRQIIGGNQRRHTAVRRRREGVDAFAVRNRHGVLFEERIQRRGGGDDHVQLAEGGHVGGPFVEHVAFDVDDSRAAALFFILLGDRGAEAPADFVQ